MTSATFMVVTYQFYEWSSRSGGVYTRTNIILTGSGGEQCVVEFKKDEDTLPKANKSGSRYNMWYHQNQRQDLIDMLRYEKPIYVFYNDDHGHSNSRISTTNEPIGEGMET